MQFNIIAYCHILAHFQLESWEYYPNPEKHTTIEGMEKEFPEVNMCDAKVLPACGVEVADSKQLQDHHACWDDGGANN